MNWPSTVQTIVAGLKILALIAGIGAAATIMATMALAILSIETKAPELELIIVLTIAALFIMSASFLATLVHKAIYPRSNNQENGEVLREATLGVPRQP